MSAKMKKNTLKLDYLNLVGKFNIDDYFIFGKNKDNIKILILRNNLINEICVLPNEIEYVDCSYNNISELIDLPFKLKKLVCVHNKLKNLDYLPYGIKYLDCSNNNICELNNLPNSVIELYCSYNNIHNLDCLPNNILIIKCSNNYITKLNNIPKNIKKITCINDLNNQYLNYTYKTT